MERRGHMRISFRGRLAAASNVRRDVDALGNTTCRAFDPLGNVADEWGAAYPVRRTYDTQGRRTSLATTRDGISWDVTRWAYDPRTGSCVSKTYADGSAVRYAYTPDNLPLRTTYASGRWIENVYDARRQVVGTVSCDGSADAVLARDAGGRLVAASNAAASVALSLLDGGAATNEAWTAGGASAALARTFDPQGRLASLSLPGRGYELAFAYDADGRLASASNALAVVSYAYTPDGLDAGYSLTLAGGVTFTRTVARDPFRRELATAVGNAAGGVPATSLAYAYDALSRPVSRNADTFAYNARGEVTAATAMDGLSSPMAATYAYDLIGNTTLAALASRTNRYAANCVNQYTSVLRVSAPSCEIAPGYDADGNLVSLGPWACAYDAANRLASVSSNGVPLVASSYDWRGRRVRKATPDATCTFFYDDWNLIEERVTYTNGTTSTIRYYWGKDLSGTLQDAGGIGGLLYLTIDGSAYVPFYDSNGNVLHYLDASGNAVARYVYDAFGNLLSQSGPLADAFRFRFSTKYLDVETGLYYYGYRFYSPALMRWLTRDPIGEDGGLNLYGFCWNNPLTGIDPDGQEILLTMSAMPDRKSAITYNGRTSGVRGVTRRYEKFSVKCVKNCVLKISGVFNLWIELLDEDSPKWKERYPRYAASGIDREDLNTLNHEMDHFRTWQAFYSFVKSVDAYDNQKYVDCEERAQKIAEKYREYHEKARKHSQSFDMKGRNQGGRYSSFPFDTSSFSWE